MVDAADVDLFGSGACTIFLTVYYASLVVLTSFRHERVKENEDNHAYFCLLPTVD